MRYEKFDTYGKSNLKSFIQAMKCYRRALIDNSQWGNAFMVIQIVQVLRITNTSRVEGVKEFKMTESVSLLCSV